MVASGGVETALMPHPRNQGIYPDKTLMKKSHLFATACSPLLLTIFAGCNGATEEPFATAKGAALHQAEDCEDLLFQIQADAIAKLDQQVANYKEGGAVGGIGGRGPGGGNIDLDDGAEVPQDNASGDGDAAPTPGAPTTGGEVGTDGGTEDPNGHSTTNTQVKDVDEADVIKIAEDGKRLYVLHATELKTIDAWPAESAHELGSAQVPGQAFELFVHEGIATVFSRVYPQDLPASSERKGSDSDSAAPQPGGDSYCYYGGDAFTQVSIFDLSGDAPVLKREMIFEGEYVSSRRHDDNFRAIVRGGFQANDLYYPDVEYYDSFGRPKSEERIKADLDRWAAEVKTDIQNSVLEDWVPRRFERVRGAWTEMDAQCGSYFVPEPGLVQGGVTQVVTFDAGNDSTPRVTSVLGGAETVYANQTTMVVAQADWSWAYSANGTGPRTALHKFELDGMVSNYQASGFAPGTLINQFAIDESAGVVRLTTTEDKMDGVPLNSVITMGQDGSSLTQLDRSSALGEPNERIFATRFVGDRAYVVTFQNTDPLYVVDLSNAEDIKVLGELHIPGFSDYMHPLGTDHLLTIGKDADDSGSVNGVALQIFDVSDATSPKLAHKETYGGFSHSEANHNHKAFTYVSDYFGEGEDLLLFPLVTYEPEYRTGLEVVKVSRENGFTKLGSIDHTSLINDCAAFTSDGVPCNYYYGEEMRRGVQIDKFIYALSQGGISVHSLEDQVGPALTTVKMEAPQYQECYYDDGVGAGGSVGIPEEVWPDEPGGDDGMSTGGTSSGGSGMGGEGG